MDTILAGSRSNLAKPDASYEAVKGSSICTTHSMYLDGHLPPPCEDLGWLNAPKRSVVAP